MARRPQDLTDLYGRTVVTEGGCHLWTGGTSGKPGPKRTGRGYARIKWMGSSWAVHRLVWLLVTGVWLKPHEQLDHTCNNRLCIRFEHLELTDHLENCRRRDERATSVAESVTESGKLVGF